MSLYFTLFGGSFWLGEPARARLRGLEVAASNLALTSLRVSMVSADILLMGMGV